MDVAALKIMSFLLIEIQILNNVVAEQTDFFLFMILPCFIFFDLNFILQKNVAK